MQKFLSWRSNFLEKYRYPICFILFLPAFFYRDFAIPTELKYLSIADEALRNNTWFTFYNHGDIYADKPPLYFWFIMLGKMITGRHLLLVIGLFSLVPAIGIAVIMDKWFKKFNVSHHPAVSNLLLLTTALFLGLSVFARMDMLMCFFIVLSLYTFFRIYKNVHSSNETWLLPVYLFLAILSKGPFGLMIPVASIVVFLIVEKQIRYIGNYFGLKQLAILGGLCVLWFSFIYWEGGTEYLHDLLVTQTVGRGINSFAHKEPIWYYFPRLLWSFAPWTILYITMIVIGIRKKLFVSDTFRFFVVIAVTNIIMLSLISAKVDVYLMPVYPFAVYLCSAICFENKYAKSVKMSLAVQAGIFVLILPCILMAKNYLFEVYELNVDFKITLLYLGIGLFSFSGIVALWMIKKNRALMAALCMSGGMILALCAFSFMMPKINKYIGFRETAEMAKKLAKEENTENYVTYRYNVAQNMDVFLGKPMEYVVSVAQLDSLINRSQKIILIARKKEILNDDAFREWIDQRKPSWAFGDNALYVIYH